MLLYVNCVGSFIIERVANLGKGLRQVFQPINDRYSPSYWNKLIDFCVTGLYVMGNIGR